MKTREQAEQRALELYPDTHIATVNQLHEVSRQAYLKGWEEAQKKYYQIVNAENIPKHLDFQCVRPWKIFSQTVV